MSALMAGAILGGSAISGLGSALGGKAAASAADQAFDIEAMRIRQLKPFLEAGKEALPQFQAGIEDIPTLEDLMFYAQRDPGLQFQQQQGMQALEGSAAARGKLLSGDTLKALMEYGQGVASQGIDTALNRALTLQGTRQSQLQSLMSSGLAAGGRNSLPELAMQRGLAQQQGIQGVTDALGGGLSNLMFANLSGLMGGGKVAPIGGGLAKKGGF